MNIISCVNTSHDKRKIRTILFQSGAFVFFQPLVGELRASLFDWLWYDVYIGNK